MKKTENVYITHVLFRGKHSLRRANAKHGERASGGDRWTEDFLREVLGNVLRYANRAVFPARMNSSTRNL